MGKLENFKQVFGQSAWFWGLPIHGDGPKGNGTFWPKPFSYPTQSTQNTNLFSLTNRNEMGVRQNQGPHSNTNMIRT